MKPIPYHDVFLSHRFADRDAVQRLHDHIERDLGRSVYVDWIERPDLDRSKVSRETAEHFREVMRACSCLIFYAGTNADESKWMPWELGFYDGRQGARRIAVCVDDLASFDPGQQEYLGLYKRWWVDRQSLPGFLEQALDDTAAMNSATYDQWQRHTRKIARDPVDYAISLVQWCYGVSANALIDPERMQASVRMARRLTAGRARDRVTGELEVAADEVVRVELDNGFVLWGRADDIVRDYGRQSLARNSGDAREFGTLAPTRERTDAARDERGLLGTASSCAGSFGKLWAPDNREGKVARERFRARYGERVSWATGAAPLRTARSRFC